ncbi:hypothetical protein [Labrys okinawensis]|nr:hypothetical protein [Labrys okinawensis]
MTATRDHTADAAHEEEIRGLIMEAGILVDLLEALAKDIQRLEQHGLLRAPLSVERADHVAYLIKGRAERLWRERAA